MSKIAFSLVVASSLLFVGFFVFNTSPTWKSVETRGVVGGATCYAAIVVPCNGGSNTKGCSDTFCTSTDGGVNWKCNASSTLDVYAGTESTEVKVNYMEYPFGWASVSSPLPYTCFARQTCVAGTSTTACQKNAQGVAYCKLASQTTSGATQRYTFTGQCQ